MSHLLLDNTLSYPKVRLRWCRARLLGFLKKWGAYILTGAFVLGSSGSDSIATITGLVSAAAAPLVWSLQFPPWAWVMAAAGYGGFGALLCWGMRPLLWASDWRDVELSLPITPSDQRHSDLSIVTIALTPFFLLCAAGLLKWMVSSSAHRPALLLIASALLLSALLISVGLGVMMLRAMRASTLSASIAIPGRAKSASTTPAWARRYPGLYTLVFLPLRRGPARRAGNLIRLAPLLLAAPVVLMSRPAQAPWWLALFAFAAQLLTTRLMALLQEELEPLHARCDVLPVDIHRLRRLRQRLALMPVTIGLAFLLPVLPGAVADLRPLVASTYVLTVWSVNFLEVILGSRTSRQQRIEPSTRAALWLVLLAVQIALASEILA